MSEDRRLAAIMFTDIVGYTSLMEKEEKRAFQLLEKNRKIHKPIFKKYKGKWLKEMGDGILASFQTISDAVYCAIEIQEACKNEPDLKLRIGIHQGEVTFQGDDVFGSGVNIASRLEEIAPISGIYVSESVYRNIHNISEIKAEFIKEETLKNVKHPIRIYEVSAKEGSDKIIQTDIKRAEKRKPYLVAGGIIILLFVAILIWTNLPINSSSKIDPNIEKSIAILPFKNLSEDQNNQYFCDGVMEGILNNLSQIKDFRVLSRSSTDKYRESTPPSPQLAEELNVNYLVEASVFKSEDRIRVTAQLIDARNDEHIWSKQYDREISDIFKVMSDISNEVASGIEVVISPEVKERIESVPTENMEAYDLYLRGRQYHTRWDHYYIDKSDISTAIYLYKQSIALDPQLAIAYVWLGLAYTDQLGQSDYFEESYYDSLKIFADKALSMDPDLTEGYVALSEYNLKNGNIEESVKQAKKAIYLNPNNGDALVALANGYKAENDYISAIINYEKVKKLIKGTQDYQLLLRTLGNAYHDISDYGKAESAYLELVKYDPGSGYWWLCHLAMTNGELDKMKKYTDQLCGLDSGLLCQRFLSTKYIYTGNFEKAVNIFEKYWEDWIKRGMILTDTYRRAYALYKLNRKAEAFDLCNKQIKMSQESIRLNRSLATGTTGGAAYFSMAGSYAVLGDKKKTYQTLHEMEKNSFSGWYTWEIQHDPIFENFWDDEEFKSIIQRQEKKFADIRAEIDRLEENGEL